MIEHFINQLDKVQKRANDYYAVCPVGNHSGKNRTLSIREKDGIVMAHCFSCGAKTTDVARHLGIKFNRSDTHRSDTPYYSEDKRMFDIYFLEFAEKTGYKNLKIKEKYRYKESKARLANYKMILENKYGRTLDMKSFIILAKSENDPRWILKEQHRKYNAYIKA